MTERSYRMPPDTNLWVEGGFGAADLWPALQQNSASDFRTMASDLFKGTVFREEGSGFVDGVDAPTYRHRNVPL